MESQPKNPEFRNKPENFHPWFPSFENSVDPDQLASDETS